MVKHELNIEYVLLLQLRKDLYSRCVGDDRGRLSSKALDHC